MMTLQEISDRLEIQKLAVDYATAVDTMQFDGLDSVFTPDAYICYREMGGIAGHYPEIKAYLQGQMGNFGKYQHMIGNHSIKVDGDSATGRLICFNPMASTPVGDQVFFLGLWYEDKYVRTAAGWRIADRREVHAYSHNVPDGLRTTAEAEAA